ncbi:MAG: tyrosine-type recombinase/integrase [Candidatus Aminicenantes bacterium]|nr:tyrosine-type recombinase/integrase [Candidatus Aminicenantes bacterium]
MTEDLKLQKSYKVKEVSSILNLKPQTVLERIWDGKLPAYKDEKEWRIMGSDIEAYRESLRSKKQQPVFQGGTMKVVKTGKRSWKTGCGGFSYFYDSKGLKRWKIWWYDSKDKRKFKHMNTDDSKIPEKVKIVRTWHQVTNEKEAFIALKAELERERLKAFAKKVARYDPDQGEKLIEALGIEEDGNGDSIKLSNLMDNWLENYAKLNHADEGKSAEAVVRYWNGIFGKKKAVELTRGELQRHFIAEQKEATDTGKDLNKVKATQKQRGTMLMGIYNWAIDEMGDYGVKVNPVKGALPKLKKREREPFTREELQLLFEKAKEFYPHMLPVQAFAAIAGARIGEVKNLRWENVNLEEGIIKLVDTKEGKSKTIDIDPDCKLYQMFSEMKKSQQKLTERDFKNGGYGHVFIYQNPRFDYKWSRIPIQDHFLEVKKLAGIDESKTFHTFRHTAGSMASNNGASSKAVQAMYGHSTIDMTQHYLHASREAKLNVVKTAEKQVNIRFLLNGQSDRTARLPQGN